MSPKPRRSEVPAKTSCNTTEGAELEIKVSRAVLPHLLYLQLRLVAVPWPVLASVPECMSQATLKEPLPSATVDLEL